MNIRQIAYYKHAESTSNSKALLELNAKSNADHGHLEADDDSNDVAADGSSDRDRKANSDAGGDGKEATDEAAEDLAGKKAFGFSETRLLMEGRMVRTRRWQAE